MNHKAAALQHLDAAIMKLNRARANITMGNPAFEAWRHIDDGLLDGELARDYIDKMRDKEQSAAFADPLVGAVKSISADAVAMSHHTEPEIPITVHEMMENADDDSILGNMRAMKNLLDGFVDEYTPNTRAATLADLDDEGDAYGNMHLREREALADEAIERKAV